jgi:hypothetical protein
MQQLETALTRLADRGEALSTDVLIGRLEAQLCREGAAIDGTPLVDPSTAPPAQSVSRRLVRSPSVMWREPLVAASTVAVVLVVVAVAIVLLRGGRADHVDVVDDVTPVVTTMPQTRTEASDLVGVMLGAGDESDHPFYPMIDGWYLRMDRWKQLVDPPSYSWYDGQPVVDTQGRPLTVITWVPWKTSDWQEDAPDVEFVVLLAFSEFFIEEGSWGFGNPAEVIDAVRLDPEGDEHFHINCLATTAEGSRPESQAVAVIVGDDDSGPIEQAWTVAADGFYEWPDLDSVRCGPSAQDW